MTKLSRTLFAGILLLISGCGSGTDPISNLGDPNQALGPGLSLPISGTLTSFTPFSSSNDGFDLVGTFALATAIYAPAAGFVTQMDSTSVTIFHNVHVISKVSGITPASVQVGSNIAASAQIGTVVGNSTIHFTVYGDGVAVCPLSYLTATGRAQMQSAVYNVYSSNPCRQ